MTAVVSDTAPAPGLKLAIGVMGSSGGSLSTEAKAWRTAWARRSPNTTPS